MSPLLEGINISPVDLYDNHLFWPFHLNFYCYFFRFLNVFGILVNFNFKIFLSHFRDAKPFAFKIKLKFSVFHFYLNHKTEKFLLVFKLSCFVKRRRNKVFLPKKKHIKKLKLIKKESKLTNFSYTLLFPRKIYKNIESWRKIYRNRKEKFSFSSTFVLKQLLERDRTSQPRNPASYSYSSLGSFHNFKDRIHFISFNRFQCQP